MTMEKNQGIGKRLGEKTGRLEGGKMRRRQLREEVKQWQKGEAKASE